MNLKTTLVTCILISSAYVYSCENVTTIIIIPTYILDTPIIYCITIWPEIVVGSLFWQIGGLRAICQYFLCQNFTVRCHHYCGNPSFHWIYQCNRWHGVHHRQLHTRTSCLQRVLDTEGGREVGLSKRGRQSKRRVHGCCED